VKECALASSELDPILAKADLSALLVEVVYFHYSYALTIPFLSLALIII